MTSRQLLKATFLIALFMLIACAPADLDVTPSPTPTLVPSATPEAAPAEDGATDQAEGGSQAFLDHLLAAVPDNIGAGAISWRRNTAEEIRIRDREGGIEGRVPFEEPSGGMAELTFGVFDGPDEAMAYYRGKRSQLRTLEQAEEREEFPQPNGFGGGTYGSDAVWVQDNIFVFIHIPRFPSTAGDPLGPFGRQVISILDEALSTYE